MRRFQRLYATGLILPGVTSAKQSLLHDAI